MQATQEGSKNMLTVLAAVGLVLAIAVLAASFNAGRPQRDAQRRAARRGGYLS